MDLQEQNKIEDLERKLDRAVALIEKFNRLNRYTISQAFIKGIFSGLGATIGLAIVFGLLGVVIKTFGGLPLLGGWLISTGRYLHR